MSDKSELLLKPRRFYKAAAAAPVEGGFAVQLDGRTPKSPARKPLVAPTKALAEMIAAEWDAQVDYIDNSLMPASRLAFTAIDRIAETRAEVAKEVTAYASSDHLCYRAEHPTPLVERQNREWGAILDWAKAEHGLTFTPVAGIIHQPQPPATLAAIEALALTLDDFTLAGVAFAAGLFGSTVLALAVRAGRLTGQRALDLSRLEEVFQAEQWGQDAEATARAAFLAVEAAMIDRWFAALR
ncbi:MULTISPECIES: ATP12 family chaperone protein [unclassified Caulobacter]|uniref:ATP12 family chaperone protein n=1 Tax=unclassified Caulobacter TaxID=2648921 RepID=UPI0006FF660C|nr:MULTISPECIES: ATP12 family protein [unclassified Caulobacter]KQV56815.1 ATPase [Caulobacter sp. Root342]KQV72454.1 ATPase [Caulobacter sp. Root343]